MIRVARWSLAPGPLLVESKGASSASPSSSWWVQVTQILPGGHQGFFSTWYLLLWFLRGICVVSIGPAPPVGTDILQLKMSLLTSAPGLLASGYIYIFLLLLLILDSGTHFLEAKLEEALGEVTMMRP